MGVTDRPIASTPGPDDDGRLGEMVSDYVRTIEVPRAVGDSGWHRRVRGTVRWFGGERAASRWGASAAVVLAVAALAVVLGATGLALRQASPATGSAVPSLPASVAGSVPPASSSSRPSSTPPPPQPGDLAWFAMSFDGGCPDVVVPPEPLWGCSGSTQGRDGYLELLVGTLDGRITSRVSRTLPASARLWTGRGSLPGAAGPFGGRVLYHLFDGSRSEIHVVDASDGRDDLVLTTSNVVYNSVLDPASGTIFYGMLDAGHRHDLGVWRLRAGGMPEPFLPAARELRYSGSQQWHRSLALTPDGSRLVVVDCQTTECAAAVYSTGDGHELASADGLRDDALFGATNADLLGIFRCDGGPCSIDAVDLASGGLRTVASDPCLLSGTGILGKRADGSDVLLVTAASGPACPAPGSVLEISLDDGSAARVWTPGLPDAATGANLTLAYAAQDSQGYATPAGWFLVAPNEALYRTNQTGSLQPALVSLSNGAQLGLEMDIRFTH
jgi:hypothetical protein